MSLNIEIRNKLKFAIRNNNELEKNIYRLILGEVDTQNARLGQCGTGDEEDKRFLKIIKKLIESNKETAALLRVTDPRFQDCLNEIKLLEKLVPSETSRTVIVDLLSTITDELKAAKSDGQATGIAMKKIKSLNMVCGGEVVAGIVKELRG